MSKNIETQQVVAYEFYTRYTFSVIRFSIYFLYLLILIVTPKTLLADSWSIEKTEFFVLFNNGTGVFEKYQTTSVPLVPKRSCYGWRIKFKGALKLARYKEILSLPSAPKYWPGENNEFAANKITNNRRVSITERYVVPKNGWIKNTWCVVKGDPVGDYSIKVFVDETFVQQFDFELKKLSQ